MKRSKPIAIFFQRLVLIFLLQFIIKIYDYSFEVMEGFSLRGFWVSLYFIVFWLALWYLAAAINQRFRQRSQLLTILIHLMVAFIGGFLSNKGYEWIDTLIFGRYEVWESINFFNPELTTALVLFYILIYVSSEAVEREIRIKKQMLKVKELEKQNILAQYNTLKQQVEPHFLFNSLSVLSSLVYSNPDLASDFILKLSKILRFIVEKNTFTLVPMREELRICSDYFFLLKTRFKEGINMKIQLDPEVNNLWYLPPASLQTLLENAVKHNKVGVKQPLTIELFLNEDFLIMKNNLNRKKGMTDSMGKGLSNLEERFQLITDRKMTVEKTDQEFKVTIPILSEQEYERFNY